eukprot:4360517-Prorocentrum_lima.AAC.1
MFTDGATTHSAMLLAQTVSCARKFLRARESRELLGAARVRRGRVKLRGCARAGTLRAVATTALSAGCGW